MRHYYLSSLFFVAGLSQVGQMFTIDRHNIFALVLNTLLAIFFFAWAQKERDQK